MDQDGPAYERPARELSVMFAATVLPLLHTKRRSFKLILKNCDIHFESKGAYRSNPHMLKSSGSVSQRLDFNCFLFAGTVILFTNHLGGSKKKDLYYVSIMCWNDLKAKLS